MKPIFNPGDQVIWLKRVPGGYVFPFQGKVLAVTAKRVKIEVDDPDEDGSGMVVRHVPPESLQKISETASPPTQPTQSVPRGLTRKKGSWHRRRTD
jgi:hypothetical protein